MKYNDSHVTVDCDCDKVAGTLYSVRENEVTVLYSSPSLPWVKHKEKFVEIVCFKLLRILDYADFC